MVDVRKREQVLIAVLSAFVGTGKNVVRVRSLMVDQKILRIELNPCQ